MFANTAPLENVVGVFDDAERDVLLRIGRDARAVLDRDGRFERVDERWGSLLGVPARALPGRCLEEFVTSADAPRLRDLLERFADGSTIQGFVLRFVDGDGETRHVDLDLAEDGGRLFVVARNATSEPLARSAAACLRAVKVRDELQRSERVRHQLELAHVSRVAAAGEFAASLAHELNQPLSAILTNARTAQRVRENAVDAADIGEVLEDIVEDARRAGSIIHKLREFLRKGTVESVPLALDEVIRDVVELLRGVDPVLSACIRVESEDDLPLVDGDRTQIEQVLINLIRNGLEAMEDVPSASRELIVRAEATAANGVVCSVTDRGAGIEDVDALFEPFYTTKDGGMGMGLPISRSIIEAHGGSLRALSSEAGTCMQFSLTASRGAEE